MKNKKFSKNFKWKTGKAVQKGTQTNPNDFLSISSMPTEIVAACGLEKSRSDIKSRPKLRRNALSHNGVESEREFEAIRCLRHCKSTKCKS